MNIPYDADAKLMADDVGLAYRRAGFGVTTRYYTYSFPHLTVATLGAVDRQELQIDSDSFFVWCGLAIQIFAQGKIGVESFTAGLGLKILDPQTGYNLAASSAAGVEHLPHQAFTGSAEAPYLFAYPYILGPGSRLIASAKQQQGVDGQPIDADLSCIGFRLYTSPYTKVLIYPEH